MKAFYSFGGTAVRKTILLVTLAYLLIFASSAHACDVNLFSIIAGTTKTDAFSEGVTGLAQTIRNLGQNSSDEKKAEKYLFELMSRWVDFSSAFNQFPPEWGKLDPAWASKFSDLGRIIGEIRRQLDVDPVRAHDEMLRFSRRLSFLYENMPKTDRARVLLDFTRSFDGLWSALFDQNHDLLKKNAQLLISSCKKLQTLVDADEKFLAANMAAWAEQIRVLSTQVNVFKAATLRMTLTAAEAEFVSLNERFSASMTDSDLKK